MPTWKTWTPPEYKNYTLTFKWTVPYAAQVHEGNPDRNQPPRRWTDHAIGENDLIKAFKTGYFESEEQMEKAWEIFGDYLHVAFQDQIKAVRYEWTGTTLRRSGQIVGSPRDIVDTGKLLKSQKWELNLS